MTSPTRWIDLDANATTAPWPEVIEAVARHQRDTYGNPGSRHALGRAARRVLEDSREQIAEILGAQPSELLFTSGGTESNNTALLGLAAGPRRLVLSGPGEHPATAETCRSLVQHGRHVQLLPVDPHGQLRSDVISTLPWNDVGLVTFLLAHNETGVIQEVTPWRDACAQASVPWHLDGVQAVGKIPVDFRSLGATTLSFGAHKFHGPRGIGGLLVRQGTRLTPRLFGGHQEQGKRPGTESVPLIAGMATALSLWHSHAVERTSHLQRLRDRLQLLLLQQCAPTVVIGEAARRLPNTLNIAFPGVDGEALLVALDLEGVCASLGSTCASGSTEPAPILLAMGFPSDVTRSSLRLTVSAQNSDDDITLAVERIGRVVARLRNLSNLPR
jgi:cysteine desulfurase